MSRYRAIYDTAGLKAEYQDGELTFWRDDGPRVETKNVHVIKDIEPYKSMINGEMITSRSQHRAHLRAHNCIEIGNEDPTKHISRTAPEISRREKLHRQLGDMSDRQANQLLKQLKKELSQ